MKSKMAPKTPERESDWKLISDVQNRRLSEMEKEMEIMKEMIGLLEGEKDEHQRLASHTERFLHDMLAFMRCTLALGVR